MKKTLILFCCALSALSCQVLDGGVELFVSGKDFTVESTGGEVYITTSGVSECSINDSYTAKHEFQHLDLYSGETVEYQGEWYAFRSEDYGKELRLMLDENVMSGERTIKITLTHGPQYTRINIAQLGNNN